MSSGHQKLFSSFVLSVAFLSGCSNAGAKGLPGSLTYALSDTVYKLILDSGSRRSVFTHNTFILDGITRVSNGSLIISASSSPMLLVDRLSNATVLRDGSHPIYLPEAGKLFFYAARDKASRLFMMELRTQNTVEEIDEGPFTSAPPVVPIGDGKIVFERSVRFGQKLFLYDLAMKTKQPLPFSECRPEGWRAATDQLICFSFAASSIYLISLDGTRHEELPELKDRAIGPYIPDVDKLLVTRARLGCCPFGEHEDLMVYDFKDRSLKEVAQDVPVGNGTAYWEPN